MAELTQRAQKAANRHGLRLLNRNTNIVICNIAAATTLLFCCIFYFTREPKMFLSDLTSYMAFFTVPFLLTLAFDMFYIIMLVVNLESTHIHRADRFDLAYKIVFSITLGMFIIRSFLGDFAGQWVMDADGDITRGTMLNVPIPIIVLSIMSGVITWCTPKIKDNDNAEF